MHIRSKIALVAFALVATAPALALSGSAVSAAPSAPAGHSSFSFGASNPSTFSFGASNPSTFSFGASNPST